MTAGHGAFVALGANLGDPLRTLQWAAREVGRLGEVQAVSRVYRTAPVGGPAGQPDYLNAAAHLRTALGPAELLRELHVIEGMAGRTRTERWEARTLDLDLILHGQLVCGDASLTLPHPRAWSRAFVLRPLADLDPELRHPVTGESVAAALARTGSTGVAVLDGVTLLGDGRPLP